jgi:hypothetical protein
MKTENSSQKTVKLLATIEANKEIQKRISDKLKYYDSSQFVNDASRYIQAIKENRMINVIKSVSGSGMSRVIKFTSCEKGTNNYYQSNYNCLFIALGYTEAKNRDGFTIGGCGMDMIFHTNYTIIHRLGRLGFLNKKQVETLAQRTPNTI